LPVRFSEDSVQICPFPGGRSSSQSGYPSPAPRCPFLHWLAALSSRLLRLHDHPSSWGAMAQAAESRHSGPLRGSLTNLAGSDSKAEHDALILLRYGSGGNTYGDKPLQL
jgi:hypothetical protein